MTIHLLSADHRAQGLEAVSRLGGVSARLGPDLLRAVQEVDGVLVLGTCNRLAILLDAPESSPAEVLRGAVTAFLAERSGTAESVRLSLWSGRAAYRELFATAAGLESMVVGEREITGQLRRALILAAAEGTVIAAMSGRDFPQEVNDWTLDKQSDSSIHTYSSAGRKMGVEFRTSSVYDQRVADLSDAVPAGTGKCGTPSTSKNSIVCFLKTEDGLVQATADSTKVTQEEIVSFANELTTPLGTA